MDNAETTYARWQIGKEQVLFVAILITGAVFFLFLFSLWAIYFVSQSTNILLLSIPILFLFLLVAVLTELFKSLRSIPENSEIYITDKGIYKRFPGKEEHKFIPWGQMNGYDLRYLVSTSALGRLFVRPTQFFLKSQYEEDNFVVEAIGENVEVLRAYLKENNVPFGFLKNS